MKILSIIGARPQFIKHAPLEKALSKYFQTVSIHTGQHYDKEMSDVFFTQLGIQEPRYKLNIGSGHHGIQTGKMIIAIEPIIQEVEPDAVLVYGDTNSTLAGAIVASKLNIPLIHIEAGLRSFNKEMPEEINRIMTDHVSSILFAPSDIAIENLKNEGITGNVFKTGDVMCDMIHLVEGLIHTQNNVQNYYYTTIHRPYNTDNKNRLLDILSALQNLKLKVKFPIHPRTASKMKEWNIKSTDYNNIEFIKPVSYIDNISLLKNAQGLITDSGGMQKEAYILKKKCITIRTETEWTETLIGGWNNLIFDKLDTIQLKLDKHPTTYVNELYGNGKASDEITTLIWKILNVSKISKH